MIYGVDVSNHQATFDFGDWDFAFVKSSEGTGFRDGRFGQHTANARAQGCAVAAYHFLRSDASIADQVATVRSLVPLDMPVIPDVEWIKNGSTTVSAPTLGQTVDFVSQLRAVGYAVPLLYLPRWYWDYWGRPSLAGLGLPPLWNSWYPDYVARPREEAVRMVPASAWAGFGGLDIAVMQFTSSPFDQNGFPGTREELNALLGGSTREEEGSMDRIVKASDSNAVYLARLDPKGPSARHLSGEEAALFPDAVTVTPQALAAFLAVAKSTPADEALVWNYAIPDGTAFTPAHLLPNKILSQGAELVGNQEALLAAFWELQTSLLKAIREIPAGPSGDVDYARVEGIIRKVFGDAAAGPLTTTTEE